MMTYVYIAVGVALMTTLFMYLDSRLTDKPKKKLIYVKVIVMNIVITLSVIYLLSWLSPTNSIKDIVQMGGKMTNKISGPVVSIKELGEEMLAGDAPF